MKATDEVLSYLEDEESKFIYQKKVEYSETGNFECIQEIAKRYLPMRKGGEYSPELENKMIDLLKDKKNIIIFGCGASGKRIFDLLMMHGIAAECFVDNDSKKIGEYRGIAIRHPQEIDYRDVDAVVISQTYQFYVEQIHEQLEKLGVAKNTFLINYIDYAARDFQWEQYFDPNIIKFGEKEIFVDAGALNLYTSKRFVEECEKNSVKELKIYAFEPDEISYRRCLEIKKSMSNVDLQLYNTGLWSRDCMLNFIETGDGDSKITQEKAQVSIKAMSLDNCVSDEVTFIKMDIEGAELEALKGAEKIIKKYKPKLAICIYHKIEDLTEIPLYIKKLVPEYKFYVRHYSDSECETILYAV